MVEYIPYGGEQYFQHNFTVFVLYVQVYVLVQKALDNSEINRSLLNFGSSV